MDEGQIGGETATAQRMRYAVIMTDYQMERVARDRARANHSHALLATFPDLLELLPWLKKVV